MPGVTTGKIDPRYADIGVPDNVAGAATIDYGSFGRRGGQRRHTDVLWDIDHAWHNIPDTVWSYTACGFPVLSKWLSYRVSSPNRPRELSGNDRDTFRLLTRRIAALVDLQADCDRAFTAATTAPLEQPIPAGVDS
ncbi:MAG: hypothetical protein ACR2F6_17090 [Mycobacteriales bacterium]